MSQKRVSLRVIAAIIGVFGLSLLSCGREVTAPGANGNFSLLRRGLFQVAGKFPTLPMGLSAGTAVPFERVRITLRREDGSVALDTVVNFPVGADSITLALNVPLPANTTSSGVPLAVNLGYVNAAGDTVFKGGPFPVTVAPQAPGAPAPPTVQVPVSYTGVGATATRVRITPKTVSGLNGDSFTFQAEALDASGQPIAGTPIVFATSTPTMVSVPNLNEPKAVLLGVRGQGTFIAQLLTGQSDTARLNVSLKPSQLLLVLGGGQTAGAGLELGSVVRVKVAAPDGVGIGGVPVTMAVTSGGGSITATSATSEADGAVTVAWTLGTVVGQQSITFTSPGLTGSPLTVTATATALPPSKLAVTAQPSTVQINTSVGVVRVAALDAANVASSDFTGTVTVALGNNPGGASLGGTKSVRAVGGIAVFPDLSIDKPGSGYTLVFSASGLSPATSAAFDVKAGAATRLSLTTSPSNGTAGAALTPAVVVSALDAQGNVATGFAGSVTLALSGGTSGATLGGTVTRAAVAGDATFSDLTVDKVGGGYTLVASSSGLTSASSSAFAIVAGSGARLNIISGNGVTQLAGTNIDSVVVSVTDQFLNAIVGRAVSFAVTTGGGTVSAATVLTDATGRAAVRWTLGTVSGPQSITVASAGATGSPLVITATATAGAATQLRFAKPPAVDWTVGVVPSPIMAEVLDEKGNRVTTYASPMTLSIATGPADAVLAGATSVTPVNGVATFDGLYVLKTGAYVLQVKSVSLPPLLTPEITVKAHIAARVIADSGASQSGSTNAQLPVPFVARVTDSYSNPISGVAVTWSVVSGSGQLSTANGTTDTNGRVRTTLTLGGTAGAVNVQARFTSPSGTTGTEFAATAVSVMTGTPTKVYLGYDNLNMTSGVATPVNVFLDAAPPSPVTVNLSTLDTLSAWSANTITIPAGSNFAVATLTGRGSGSTRAVAASAGLGADTLSGYVYAATISLLNSWVTLGANGDSAETRVQLNAPAPAGGVTVSFDLSAAGYVHIVPSPGLRVSGGGGGGSLRTQSLTNAATVYIKPGETQGYLWIISDSLLGNVNITPVAAGYGSQTATANVIARGLSFGGSIALLPNWTVDIYAGRQTYGQTPFTMTFTSRDSTIAKMPRTAVIPANSYSLSVPVTAVGVGSVYLVATAPGYTPDSLLVTVRPQYIFINPRPLVTANAAASNNPSLYVYAGDSAGSYVGVRATPLSVRVTRRGTGAAFPVDTVVTIAAGSQTASVYYTAPINGQDTIFVSAPDHLTDARSFTVVRVYGNPQVASWVGQAVVGAGQFSTPYFSTNVSLNSPRKAATTLNLASSNPSVAIVDGTTVVPAAYYSSDNFRLSGIAPGTATVTWSADTAAHFASGYQPVTVTTPYLYHNNPYSPLRKGESNQYFTVFLGDSLRGTHYRLSDLVVSLRSTNPAKLRPQDSTVTIYQGSYYNYPYLVPVDTGTASIIIEAAGHHPDTLTLTVLPQSTFADTLSRLNLSAASMMIGRRQYTEFYLSRSGPTPATHVSIRHKGVATALADTAFDMNAGQGYSYNYRVDGIANGTDTLIVSAPGHVPDTMTVVVTTPKLALYATGENYTLLQNYPYGTLYFYATDSLGNSHYSMDSVRVDVSSSAPGVAHTSAATMNLLPGNYYQQAQLVLSGPGQTRFTISDPRGTYPSATTGYVTVLQPRLYFSYSATSLSVGMRQSTENNEVYLYTNYPVLVPTWIKLQRSSAGLLQMPDSVLLNSGNSYAYFRVTGADTVGGLQVTASAPGFASATVAMQAARPRIWIYNEYMYFGEGSRSIDVVAMESGSNIARTTTEPVRVTLSAGTSGTVGLDSAAVTIPTGYYMNSTARITALATGKESVSGSDDRSIFQKYLPGTGQMTVYPSYIYPQNGIVRIGVGQRTSSYWNLSFYPELPTAITRTGSGGHSSLTGVSLDTLPSGNYYRYFNVAGQSVGTDTVVLSRSGFANGRLFVEVSPGSFTTSNVPISLSAGAVSAIYVYLRSPDNSNPSSVGTTPLSLSGSNGFFSDATGAPISSASILDGEYYTMVYLKAGTTPGTATFTITAPNYQSKSFTVQVVP